MLLSASSARPAMLMQSCVCKLQTHSCACVCAHLQTSAREWIKHHRDDLSGRTTTKCNYKVPQRRYCCCTPERGNVYIVKKTSFSEVKTSTHCTASRWWSTCRGRTEALNVAGTVACSLLERRPPECTVTSHSDATSTARPAFTMALNCGVALSSSISEDDALQAAIRNTTYTETVM
jgi:hypothetical protein